MILNGRSLILMYVGIDNDTSLNFPRGVLICAFFANEHGNCYGEKNGKPTESALIGAFKFIEGSAYGSESPITCWDSGT